MTDRGHLHRAVGRLSVTALAAAMLCLLLALAGVALYLGRSELARRAALAWIEAQHVPADVQIRALGPTGLKAKVRIGPESHPDLTVEDIDVSYSLDSFLRGKGLNVTAVRLRRPVLRATWRNGRLSLGSLDRLIAALAPRPGAPAAPLPRIAVRGGLVRLTSDYGAADVVGDADLDQGRLERLDAVLSPTTLRFGSTTASLSGASVRATRSGGQLRLWAQAQIANLAAAQAHASDAALTLRADLVYAALARGRVEGWLSGHATASSAAAGDLTASGLTLDFQSPALKLGSSVSSAPARLQAAAAELKQQDLRLEGLSIEGSGGLSADAKGVVADFTGGATGSGASAALGPVAKDDAPVFAAVKRSLQSFRFTVPRAQLSLDHGRFSARLLSPARVTSASGGALDLRPVGRGYGLTLTGGGMPEASADIRRVDFTGDAVLLQTRVAAAFSLGLLDRAQVKADGLLTVRGAKAAFTSTACADVAAKRLDFGDNSAVDFTAKLCPAGGPMLTVSPDRWTIAGRAKDAAARVPTFEAGLGDGSGAMRLQGHGKDLGAELVVDQVKVADLAKPLRFNPVTGSGRAVLAGNLFSGRMDLHTPKGAPIAHADFHDDVETMNGGMTISAPLTFTQGGLQPTELSPLTAALGEPAVGKVTFDGRFDWAGDKTRSRGRLTVQNLSFRSPAGAVTALSGAMSFSDLAPLTGATDGLVKAERIAGVVALADLSARARIDDQTVTVTDAQGSVGGGRVRINATALLTRDQTVKGEVTVDKVQVHDLVQASPFSDKMSMTAELSGRAPFQMADGKLRILNGSAKADGPGRLSIKRSTFNPGGAPSGPATQDNLSTFGYQAMEDLAFQALDASINSLPDGKLHMVFRVRGRHDPPTTKELRLTSRDFFDRHILNKPMPLPSGTEVNLTLDMTLNLDNLVQSQARLQKELGSVSVQTSSARTGADTTEGPK